MTTETHPKAALLPNRLAAAIALIFTGWMAALAIRDVLLRPIRLQDWFFPIFPPLFKAPHWVAIAVNAAFYAYLIWICVCFFRFAKGKERVVIAGWLLGFVLYPAERFSPTVSVARYVEATAMGISLLAALAIFLEFYGPRGTRIETSADDH